MWKFIVDVVHDFVSSLQPDVGRGFLHVSNVFLFQHLDCAGCTAPPWCHDDIQAFLVFLALCEGNPPVTSGFASQRASSLLLYPRPTKLEGGYTGFTLSVRPSVRLSVCPSVCRRHGFRSISQVCFRISISNFICMLMVAIGRSLLIFSDFTFKMAAWRPYWIFWFPDSNFTLALNINFKLQRHNTYVYG